MTLNLDLPHTETFDEWRDLGRKLCTSHRTLNWMIGGWLIDGSERYGDKARDEAKAIFRSDETRFDPIVRTCRRFPEERRHEALTFGHHLAVMAVDDDAEADRLLTQAETNRLTVAQFKAEVRVRTNRQPSFIDDDPVDAAYRRIVHAWNHASTEARELFAESIAESHMGVIEI